MSRHPALLTFYPAFINHPVLGGTSLIRVCNVSLSRFTAPLSQSCPSFKRHHIRISAVGARSHTWRIWTPGTSLTYDRHIAHPRSRCTVSVGLAQARPNYTVDMESDGAWTHTLLGECITLWGERERGSVVSRSNVSSHLPPQIEILIACRRSGQLLTFSAGRAHTGV